MKFEIRVKLFAVLIKNRIAKVTSVDCTTQWVDECQVQRRKGRPTTVKKPSSEGRLPF